MRAVYVVTVEIDEGLIKLDAKRRGRSTEQQFAEVVADCECRLVDSVRWRDSVTRVGSELLLAPQETRQ